MKLEGSFHSAAVARATSYFSPVSSFNDITGGVGYYEFLERTVKEYENNKKALIKKLEEVAQKLFTSDNMLISYTADETGYSYLPMAVQKLKNSLPEGNGTTYPYRFPAGNKNEGFTTASQVNYVARCGSFRGKYAYTGALRILKVILSYDYLWINLRVKGGAYGCMSGFGRSGEGYLVSYRDPNLKETNGIYEGIPEYLENLDIDERDMTKYVIGTISDLDIPYPPSSKGSRGLSAYLSGVTPEMMREERTQILDADQEDIRKLAGLVKAVLDTKSLCVIGNKDKIEAERTLFKEVKNLYHS